MSQTIRHNRALISGLCLSLILIVFAVPSVLAQPRVEIIKSEQPITCNGKDHQLRLVIAEAPINGMAAGALAIVLTPDDDSVSKVFGIYWFSTSTSPTDRDDTNGMLGNSLRSYEKGLTPQGVPVVEGFFSESKCDSKNAQVIGIQKWLATENLLKQLSSSALVLKKLAEDLSLEGVKVDAEEVQPASEGDLALFKGLSGELQFAKAIREYVSNVLAAEGRSDSAGTTNTLEQEIKRLQTQNKDLADKVKASEDEKNSFFGATPTWLFLVFVVTFILALGGVAVIALAVYKNLPLIKGNQPPPPDGQSKEPEAPAKQPGSDQLDQTILASRQRLETIDHKYADLEQLTTKGQKDKDSDRLVETMYQRLENYFSVRERNQAKSIITQTLSPVSGNALQSRQRGDELRAALVELQQQFETVPKDSTLKPSSPTQTPSVSQNDIAGKLSRLANDIGSMKTSVDGFSSTLAKSLEARRQLQDLWAYFYQKDYNEEQTNTLIREVKDVVELYRFFSARCSKPGASITQTRVNLEQTFTELEQIRKSHLATSISESALLGEVVARIKIKLGNDANKVSDFGEMEKSLRDYFAKQVRGNENAPHLLTRLITEQLTARGKLGAFYPVQDFNAAIDAVVTSHDTVTKEVNRALPNESGSLGKIVNSLTNEYLKLKPEAERAQGLETERNNLQQRLVQANSQLVAGKELVEEISVQLNFNNKLDKEDSGAITAALGQLKKERDESVYLQLRLGLSSAKMALEKATKVNGSEEQTEVINALLLDKVKDGIQNLLSQMEGYSGDQLWNQGLFLGFSQKWLHNLIRADLLLRTYYAERSEFGFLRSAVSFSCSALLTALHEFQVEVVEVGLFQDLPKDMETEPVYSGLRNLLAVRNKISSEIQNLGAKELIVDVTSFPYFVKGVKENRGCAARANPSAWLQH